MPEAMLTDRVFAGADWGVLGAIAVLGVVSYALRAGGYALAAIIPERSCLGRFLRITPGNLFVAFVAAGCLENGWASLSGSAAALLAMMLTEREWAALGAGFGVAALTAALLPS